MFSQSRVVSYSLMSNDTKYSQLPQSVSFQVTDRATNRKPLCQFF